MSKPERLISLDVFRGMTVAGMLLVNNPGTWSAIYPPLEHAAWNGWTPTDLVFPFFIFIFTHGFVIVYAIVTHAGSLGSIPSATTHEVHTVSASVGMFGLLALLLKAYSMGAGTYTGIEAVSNGLPILREPRVKTGRRTMVYMGASLALTVTGLLLAYLLYNVKPEEGQTLNSVLVKTMTAPWNHFGGAAFVWITLASEGALLLIAAQTGFLDGPRVLANMALDHWLPTRFANLSDRLVTQNGLVLMGIAAFIMMAFTRGSVDLLVVLYSINVFITFSLSQLGMVIHWWQERAKDPTAWRKLAINGFGFSLTFCILIALTAEKFFEGGWITIIITSILVAASFAIKRHYLGVHDQLRRLDAIVEAAEHGATPHPITETPDFKPRARTAIVLVNGYNGLGLHTLLHVPRMFGDTFRNFVFIQVGTVDAGNFKGSSDIDALRAHTTEHAERYVQWARRHGYGADAFTAIGRDVIGEALKLAEQARTKFPNSVFFAGQLLFARETWVNRFLHNHTAFSMQRRFYLASLPFVVLPIRVELDAPQSDEPLTI